MRHFDKKTTERRKQVTTEWKVFDSFAELADRQTQSAGRKNKRNKRLDDFCDSEHADFVGQNFNGDWKAVADQANQGWQEGYDIVERMLRQIENAALPKPKDRRRRTKWSGDNGDDVCLDRLRSGQDFWRATEKRETQGPATITLVANMSTPAQYSSEKVLWRAAAAIVLAKHFEEQGYRVELWAVGKTQGCYTDGANRLIAVCLKRAAEVLDVATLIASVAGWSYRTLWLHECGHSKRRVDYGLGTPTDITPDEAKELTTDKPLFLEKLWTESDAIKRVRQVLADYAQRN